MPTNYDDVADLFEELAGHHDRLAQLLSEKNDPAHAESDAALIDAERIHAETCRRAAHAMRLRRPVGRPRE